MASNSFPPEKLGAIAQEVSALLKEKDKTVAVAETVRIKCLISVGAHINIKIQAAGGLISAALLATPGASAIYKGGLTVCTSHQNHQNRL
jgi:nicotinamide mononucleotide (NMN) deamidase PncC